MAQNQAKYLAKEGHSVQVLTSSVGSKERRRDKDGYSIHRVLATNLLESQFSIPFPLFSPSIIFKAMSLVRESDVVHVNDAFYISSFVAAFWAWVYRKPLIVTQHVAMIPHPKKMVEYIQTVVYKTSGRFIFHTGKKIILYNSRVRAFLTGSGVRGDKLVWIQNGTDLSLFSPVQPNSKKVIRDKYNLPQKRVIALFVGRFVAKKGFSKLLESVSDGYTIAMVGGDTPTGYSNSQELLFLGSFEQKELADIYKACDIFILPSEAEGFPLSIQEAMASGLPVITTNDPGYDVNDFDKALFVLITPTIDEIKKYLDKLSRDPQLRERMGKYSAEYARSRFSWTYNAEMVTNIYQEVL